MRSRGHDRDEGSHHRELLSPSTSASSQPGGDPDSSLEGRRVTCRLCSPPTFTSQAQDRLCSCGDRGETQPRGVSLLGFRAGNDAETRTRPGTPQVQQGGDVE